MRNPLSNSTPDAITSDDQASEARARLDQLRGECQRWERQRADVAAERGECLATGTTTSLAEAGRLSAKLSVGATDDQDRREVVRVIERRIAAWEAGRADRDRDAAETELALAAQIARDAEDAVAAAALALVAAMTDLDGAAKAFKAARASAISCGADADAFRPPANARKLIASLMAPAPMWGTRPTRDAIVASWLNRARASRGSGLGVPELRRVRPPRRPPGGPETAGTFIGIPRNTIGQVHEEGGSSVLAG